MVTMSDIAVQAGVSQAAVSYVLNGRSEGIRMREDTRRRILDAAARLGYRRNDLARAMVTGKSFVLGFLTRTPSSEGSSRILVGACEEATEHGYLVKLLPFARDGAYHADIERCMEQRLAGVLVQNLGEEALDYLRSEAGRFDMPVMLVDDAPLQCAGHHVCSDDDMGMGAAVAHLAALGHARIGFVSAQAASPMAAAREQKFREAMRTQGLEVEPDNIVATDWSDTVVIEQGVLQILGNKATRPTSLICAGDSIAMVAQRVARSLQITVPAELSVIGFADYLMAEYADPPLTTIAQPFEDIGRIAVRTLMKCQSSGGQPPATGKPTLLPPQLIVRASTAPPRKAICTSAV